MRFGARGDARDASANRQQCARTGSASPERESDIFTHYTLLFFFVGFSMRFGGRCDRAVTLDAFGLFISMFWWKKSEPMTTSTCPYHPIVYGDEQTCESR